MRAPKGLGQVLGKLVLETLPALVGFLIGWAKRESRVRIEVQVNGDTIGLDLDARTLDDERTEALAVHLRQALEQSPSPAPRARHGATRDHA